MKKFNKKQIEKLEKYFDIYEDDDIIQLESWTDGGVDMVIYIDKRENIDYIEQFKNFINNFDIDEEIEIHRQDKQYKNDFTITESLEDFTSYLNDLKKIYNNIK